jgi:hypothetical protein
MDAVRLEARGLWRGRTTGPFNKRQSQFFFRAFSGVRCLINDT